MDCKEKLCTKNKIIYCSLCEEWGSTNSVAGSPELCGELDLGRPGWFYSTAEEVRCSVCENYCVKV